MKRVRAQAHEDPLLVPITVVIIWFQVLLNPLPVPLATVAVVVLCEVMLLRAYAKSYAGMFVNTF